MANRFVLVRKVDVFDALLENQLTESPELYERVLVAVERTMKTRLSRPIAESIRIDIRVQVLSLKQVMTMSGMKAENKLDIERFRKQLGQSTFRVTVPESCMLGKLGDSPTTSGQNTNRSRKRTISEISEATEAIECKIVKQETIDENDIPFVRRNLSSPVAASTSTSKQTPSPPELATTSLKSPEGSKVNKSQNSAPGGTQFSKTVPTTSKPAASYRVPPLQISGVLSDILAKHFPNSSDSVQRSRRENLDGQETSTTNSQSRIENISQSNPRPVVRVTPLPRTNESNPSTSSLRSSTQQATNPLARTTNTYSTRQMMSVARQMIASMSTQESQPEQPQPQRPTQISQILLQQSLRQQQADDDDDYFPEMAPPQSNSRFIIHEFYPTLVRLMKWRARKDYYRLRYSSRLKTRRFIKEALGEISRFMCKLGLRLVSAEINPIELDECDFKLTIRPPRSQNNVQNGPNVNNLLFFKDRHSVSDRAYQDLRRVCNVRLPSLVAIKNRKNEVNAMLAIHNNPMGVFYSLREKLKFRLESYLNRKYGIDALRSNSDSIVFRDEIMHIKLAADGTNIGRSLKLLNFTFTIINEGSKAKTATGNYTIGIFEIEEENRAAVNESFRELTDEIENTHELEVHGKMVKIVFYYGGDWKMLANSLGIQGANSKYCCVWCKCPKDDFHRLDLEWSIVDPSKGARTHEEQAAILNHPDYNKIVTYGYQKEPIFRDVIPIHRYMIDMLHLFLRISDTLMNLLIKDCCLADGFDMSAISKFDVTKYKHMNSLQHFINEKCNVKFSFFWVQETKKLTWRDLAGPEKIRVFENLNLAEIIPDHAKFNEVTKIWMDFYEILNLVKAVELDANQLKQRTHQWLELFLSVYSKSTVTPYMHAFVAHLHEFVHLYKDINAFNCQGLEKLNDISTVQYFKGTNKKETALHQMLKKRNRIEFLADYIHDQGENQE